MIGKMAPITVLTRACVDALELELECLPAALAEAMAESDPVRGAGLVLAARRRGQPFELDPEIGLWLLQRMDDPVLLPCLAGATADPLALLLRFLESEPLADSRGSALVVCALLWQDRPVSEEFVRLVRRSVLGLRHWQTGPVGMALEKLPHLALQELARELRPPLSMSYRGALEIMRRGLAGDFEEALLDSLDDSQPFRRSEPKVGRNDACPCGSGLKFKKCCQNKPKTSAYQRWQPPSRVIPYRLPLHELVQLRPPALDTATLYLLVEDLSYRGPLDLADQALDELLKRPDLPYGGDEILDTFLLGASQRADAKWILRLLDRFSSQASEEVRREKSLLQLLLQPHGLELDAQLTGLLDDPEAMGDMAYVLRRYLPAFSVLLGRLALVQGGSELDADTHLNGLTMARARLGLGEEDPIEKIWFQLSDQEEDEEESGPDPAVLALQKELSEARQRLRQLEVAGAPQVRAGKTPTPKAEPDQRPAQVSASPAQAPAPPTAKPEVTPDPEVKRLRERLHEVKNLLRERNQERARLRQELKTHQAQPSVEGPVPSLQAEGELEPDPELAEARLPPLLPEWTKTAAQELRQLPTSTARLALRMTGELAAGLPTTWQKTKPIQHVEGLHSIRLGLNHRMLFTPDLEAGSLRVDHLVTRGDHDRVVKQLGR